MSAKRFPVVVVGVGGQGSVFIARALGEAALRAGLGVVASELHGMAQRGGVVESTVIIGDAHGPIIAPGEGALLLALEPLEALRALSTLRQGAAAVVATAPIVPFTVSMGGPPYPKVEKIIEKLKGWLGTVVALDLEGLARGAGERRAIGAAALGAASRLGCLPIPASILREATLSLAPPDRRVQNGLAFDAGFGAAGAAVSPEAAQEGERHGER